MHSVFWVRCFLESPEKPATMKAAAKSSTAFAALMKKRCLFVLMPELPEVEVTRMGLAPFVEGKVLRKAVIRVQRLRSPVGELAQKLDAKTVLQLSRRGKYLVWHFVDAQGVKGSCA